MNACGIDPGKTGALVVLRPDGTSSTLRMPIKEDGKSIDGIKVAAWLIAHEVDFVIVEKIEARGHRNKEGKAIRNAGNEFRFAIGVGVIHGCLDTLKIPYALVRPMIWKPAILKGLGLDKEAAIKYVQLTLPHVDLKPGRCTTPQDGIADAACLAVFAGIYAKKRQRFTK